MHCFGRDACTGSQSISDGTARSSIARARGCGGSTVKNVSTTPTDAAIAGPPVRNAGGQSGSALLKERTTARPAIAAIRNARPERSPPKVIPTPKTAHDLQRRHTGGTASANARRGSIRRLCLAETHCMKGTHAWTQEQPFARRKSQGGDACRARTFGEMRCRVSASDIAIVGPVRVTSPPLQRAKYALKPIFAADRKQAPFVLIAFLCALPSVSQSKKKATSI